jgi:hypothetical protein
MKTLRSLITACIAIFALSSVAFALPPGKTGAQLPTLTKKLCKEGRMVYCPVCKKKYKVTWTPPGKSGGPLTEKLTIVNEKGEPCMFFAKLS